MLVKPHPAFLMSLFIPSLFDTTTLILLPISHVSAIFRSCPAKLLGLYSSGRGVVSKTYDRRVHVINQVTGLSYMFCLLWCSTLQKTMQQYLHFLDLFAQFVLFWKTIFSKYISRCWWILEPFTHKTCRNERRQALQLWCVDVNLK